MSNKRKIFDIRDPKTVKLTPSLGVFEVGHEDLHFAQDIRLVDGERFIARCNCGWSSSAFPSWYGAVSFLRQHLSKAWWFQLPDMRMHMLQIVKDSYTEGLHERYVAICACGCIRCRASTAEAYDAWKVHRMWMTDGKT